jgi:hypothetical protein
MNADEQVKLYGDKREPTVSSILAILFMLTVPNKTCVRQTAVTSGKLNTIKICGNDALKNTVTCRPFSRQQLDMRIPEDGALSNSRTPTDK